MTLVNLDVPSDYVGYAKGNDARATMQKDQAHKRKGEATLAFTQREPE